MVSCMSEKALLGPAVIGRAGKGFTRNKKKYI